jgi:hypothetical protein
LTHQDDLRWSIHGAALACAAIGKGTGAGAGEQAQVDALELDEQQAICPFP